MVYTVYAKLWRDMPVSALECKMGSKSSLPGEVLRKLKLPRKNWVRATAVCFPSANLRAAHTGMYVGANTEVEGWSHRAATTPRRLFFRAKGGMFALRGSTFRSRQ